jgi:hypothetical protein
MTNEASEQERRILQKLRIVLGNIVKDTAPRPDVPSPLRDATIQSIRELFAMIAERERELADLAGRTRVERPHFADEPQAASVVTLHPADKSNKLN